MGMCGRDMFKVIVIYVREYDWSVAWSIGSEHTWDTQNALKNQSAHWLSDACTVHTHSSQNIV